jgi:putative Holliday junction resolvase
MTEPARGFRQSTAGIGHHPHAFMSPPPEATLLAFDFGTRRIGVAVGNTLVRVAHPLTTIEGDVSDQRFAAIAALVGEWRPDRLVVGIPVHADGTEHAMTRRARRFARQLAGRFALPVVEVDERHTTQDAEAQLSRAGEGGRRSRARRDEVAAQLILQGYLDEQPQR